MALVCTSERDNTINNPGDSTTITYIHDRHAPTALIEILEIALNYHMRVPYALW